MSLIRSLFEGLTDSIPPLSTTTHTRIVGQLDAEKCVYQEGPTTKKSKSCFSEFYITSSNGLPWYNSNSSQHLYNSISSNNKFDDFFDNSNYSGNSELQDQHDNGRLNDHIISIQHNNTKKNLFTNFNNGEADMKEQEKQKIRIDMIDEHFNNAISQVMESFLASQNIKASREARSVASWLDKQSQIAKEVVEKSRKLTKSRADIADLLQNEGGDGDEWTKKELETLQKIAKEDDELISLVKRLRAKYVGIGSKLESIASVPKLKFLDPATKTVPPTEEEREATGDIEEADGEGHEDDGAEEGAAEKKGAPIGDKEGFVPETWVTLTSSGCACIQQGYLTCGLHQGSPFSFCKVADKEGEDRTADPNCQVLKPDFEDPIGWDHTLYQWEPNVGRVMSVGEDFRPTPARWDYCIPRNKQVATDNSPLDSGPNHQHQVVGAKMSGQANTGAESKTATKPEDFFTAHPGCKCKSNEDILAKYDPIRFPRYASTDPLKPNDIDIEKVPWKDRPAVEIMQKVYPNSSSPSNNSNNNSNSSGVENTSKNLCREFTYNNSRKMHACPVDPICLSQPNVSNWFFKEKHTWDFCSPPGHMVKLGNSSKQEEVDPSTTASEGEVGSAVNPLLIEE